MSTGHKAQDHTKSTFAVWHDPMTYDHHTMGPPYLPESKAKGFAREAGSPGTLDQVFLTLFSAYHDLPRAELGALLSCLRAGALIHQTHHWQTRGDTFYGDHLLYDRLYKESVDFIDQVAERAVGSGGHLLVHPLVQASQIQAIVGYVFGDISTDPSPDNYAKVSLATEVFLLEAISLAYKLLEEKSQLSHGTDNLLQGVSDKHEEFVYLLRQRCQKVSYDRR